MSSASPLHTPAADPGRDRAVLTVAAGVLVAAMAAIGRMPSPHTGVPVFLAIYGVAFAAYLVAVRAVLRRRDAPFHPLVVLLVCALSHAAVIPARPDLSTDVYRYAWEGRVVLDGHNPFSTPPEDTTLVALRDADYAHISHKPLATIYPPLAQGVFALAALIHPGPAVLKILFSLFNLGTVWAVCRLLRRRGLPESRALILAWSPLVIVETGHSGHVDAMAAFFLVLAIDLWETKRRVATGLVLGASALVKFLALAAVPWLARRRQFALLAVLAFVLAAGYVPFLGAGTGLFSSLREYSASWSFNGPPFIALSGFLGDPAMARRLLAGAGIAFALAAAFRERDLARYAFLVIACALLVSPTVYPWYMLWIMPLLCLFPGRAWLAFSGLVMLSYGVWTVYSASGFWFVPTWLLALEYVPFYILLLAGLMRAHGRARAAA